MQEVRDLLKLVSMDRMQHLVTEQMCTQLLVIFWGCSCPQNNPSVVGSIQGRNHPTLFSCHSWSRRCNWVGLVREDDNLEQKWTLW